MEVQPTAFRFRFLPLEDGLMVRFDLCKEGSYICLRKARKNHVCIVCGKKIALKETYVQRSIRDGDSRKFRNDSICPDCFYGKDFVESPLNT